MKKKSIAISFALFTCISFGQETEQLNSNNVSVTINDNGYFFHQNLTNESGYEVPAGSGRHAIHTGSFWFGGTDVNGQLKMAAQQNYGNGRDYFPGPLLRYEAVTPGYSGQTLWTVTKAEIDEHIANYQSSNYTMPDDLENWPAHCYYWPDFSIDGLPFIAPFVDVNNNDIYDPINGDYPCIKGDEATFLILNDKANLHTASNGEPIGMQLHFMFYQFNTIPELENTTFVDVEVVNMGTQTLFNTKAGLYIDANLGNAFDDYIGTDVQRNMVFAYNADNYDENNSGELGYLGNPPAFGVKVLSHDLHSSIAYRDDEFFPMTDPTDNIHFRNAMEGNYLDGTDQIDGQGNPTNFYYDGDPTMGGSWSEIAQINLPGDRRLLASVDVGTFYPDMTTGAAERRRFSYALIYSQGFNHLSSVDELKNTADFVQNHYDNATNNCFDFQIVDVNEIPEIEFVIAPNPNMGTFSVQLSTADLATASIIDAQGRIVHSQEVNQGANKINVSLESGIYLVTVSTGNSSTMQRMVIRSN